MISSAYVRKREYVRRWYVGTRDTGNYSLAMLNVRVRSRKTVA